MMVGTTFGFDAERDGFFFFPVDREEQQREGLRQHWIAVKKITNLPRGAKTA